MSQSSIKAGSLVAGLVAGSCAQKSHSAILREEQTTLQKIT
jgi:hypothetical protein